MATKRKSRILDEMHETANGLHAAGLTSKPRMREIGALFIVDMHEIPPQKQIRTQREKRT